MKTYKQLLTQILLKKAKGFSVKEKVEEFAVINGQMSLVKRKISTKKVLPDVNAIKALLQIDDQTLDVTKMTDEQLAVEKLRLLQLLDACNDTADTNQTPQEDTCNC